MLRPCPRHPRSPVGNALKGRVFQFADAFAHKKRGAPEKSTLARVGNAPPECPDDYEVITARRPATMPGSRHLARSLAILTVGLNRAQLRKANKNRDALVRVPGMDRFDRQSQTATRAPAGTSCPAHHGNHLALTSRNYATTGEIGRVSCRSSLDSTCVDRQMSERRRLSTRRGPIPPADRRPAACQPT